MARQFYGEGGVPLRVDCDPWEPARAWRSHRCRLRSWLDELADTEWDGPTRCAAWDTTALVRHLASGSHFLGYTLHKANQGEPTSLLAGFDPQETPRQAAEMLGQLSPSTARSTLQSMDAAVAAELVQLDDSGWTAVAEAPPGHVPAFLTVSHFLWDSWVHEYDLMLPRGERPPVDAGEASIVAAYLLGLASVATGSTTALGVRLSDPVLQVGVDVRGGRVEVTTGAAPRGAAVVEGTLSDVVDRATGRTGGRAQGDARALAVLDGFAEVLGSS